MTFMTLDGVEIIIYGASKIGDCVGVLLVKEPGGTGYIPVRLSSKDVEEFQKELRKVHDQ